MSFYSQDFHTEIMIPPPPPPFDFFFFNHLPLCYREQKIALSVEASGASHPHPPSRGHSREELTGCHTTEDPSVAASVASHCLRQKLGHIWTTGV